MTLRISLLICAILLGRTLSLRAQEATLICQNAAPRGAGKVATIDTSLAGTYSLILINTNRGWAPRVWAGVLELWPNTPMRQAGWGERVIGRRAGPRPLAGTIAFTTYDRKPAPSSPPRPRQPDNPDAEVLGTTLALGPWDANDASGEYLQIQRVSPSGFWGTWEYDGGIAVVVDSATGKVRPDPKGYFCAIRTDKRGKAP